MGGYGSVMFGSYYGILVYDLEFNRYYPEDTSPWKFWFSSKGECGIELWKLKEEFNMDNIDEHRLLWELKK